MAFATGLFLLDAPASALNNLGEIPGERYDNSVGVKVIRTKEGFFPYVSAQAFRYWLRRTLETSEDIRWVPAPVYREKKIAYTDANPIRYWDDDLFGYMRAQSTRTSARAEREADESRTGETETEKALTRVSPFRVSTLVSIAPVTPTRDYGVMARQEGPPVPYEHQFYRTTLKGLFSLDLYSCGTFWYREKTGFRNLDDKRLEEARERNLKAVPGQQAVRLPIEERLERITALFEGMAVLDGGAKQALHYTDVTPPLVILAVTKGGNHVFGYVIGADNRGLPEIRLEALRESLHIYQDEILSDVYMGWKRGYLDDARNVLEEVSDSMPKPIRIGHPREAFAEFIAALRKNPSWLE